MQYLKTYLQRIIQKGNINLAKSIEQTAEEVGTKHIIKFSFISHEIGLLFGNVQSGKTGQMFGILTKAADLGFSAFVLLTTDNIVLQQQTLDRVKADLDGFCVCGENDSGLFIENSLEKPTTFVNNQATRNDSASFCKSRHRYSPFIIRLRYSRFGMERSQRFQGALSSANNFSRRFFSWILSIHCQKPS